jgi:hypothetical protein
MTRRRGFRESLAGLPAPRERNKTLTALAGAEPVTGAQHPAVQRLQFFLSESRRDAEQISARHLEAFTLVATFEQSGEDLPLRRRPNCSVASLPIRGLHARSARGH